MLVLSIVHYVFHVALPPVPPPVSVQRTDVYVKGLMSILVILGEQAPSSTPPQIRGVGVVYYVSYYNFPLHRHAFTR